jgi:Flp pilus assembly protein TadG
VRLLRVLPDDRGAITALVAVLLAGGALLGITAVVVDIGQVYLARETLLTAADAASLAVAKQCGTGPTCTPRATAEDYVRRNVPGDQPAVALCGAGWGLSACAPLPAEPNLAECAGTRPATGPYVEVRVRVVVPPSFARALAGRENSTGTPVSACARAAAGQRPATNDPGDGRADPTLPLEMRTPAIALTECYRTAAGYATTERVLRLTPDPTDPCAPAPTTPGWLAHTGTCTGTFAVDGPAGYAGVAAPDPACQNVLDGHVDRGTPMPVPLYDAAGPGGYHLVGFAALRLTGYRLPGRSRPSALTGTDPCTGADTCLYGWFTQYSYPIVRGGGTRRDGATSLQTRTTG